MKAVRLFRVGSLVELVEMPVPEPGPGEVLVRVKAAGICHSDAHYRSGRSPARPLPVTLGHEVAGIIGGCGKDVSGLQVGDRVCLHYLVTCGVCEHCRRGDEQFCFAGKMIGKHRDGGFAEYIVVPERNAFRLPAGVLFEEAAIAMCSSATTFHAMKKGRLCPGETLAIFGAGGLGYSAIQLGRAMGAGRIFAIDINPDKLEKAMAAGAEAIDARKVDVVQSLMDQTGGKGVDVALELVGVSATSRQAVQSLGIRGRAMLVGIGDAPFEVMAYNGIINKEAEIIGVSDHLAAELPELLRLISEGKVRLGEAVSRTVPLDASMINTCLDQLESFESPVRTVIIPGS